jgi:FkbM family methyltransferase
MFPVDATVSEIRIQEPAVVTYPEGKEQCVRDLTESQVDQEMVLLPYLHLLAGQNKGTFVELGALDGHTMSNTLAIEACFEWRGLLIEGNPNLWAELNETMKNRNHSTHECMAVCEQEGTVNFTSTTRGWSGIPEKMFDQHKNDFGGYQGDTVKVPCNRLDFFLKEHDMASGVDFLSLDVEGGEELVLGTVDISLFKLILIELGQDSDDFPEDNARRSRIVKMLTDAGFEKPQSQE